MSSSFFKTRICDDFGIEYPIFLAGMGGIGKATPPELVAAVSEAGGLGVLGLASLDGDEIRRRIRSVRNLTDKPFGVDVLLPASMASSVIDRAEMRARLQRDHPRHVAFVESLFEKFGLPRTTATNPAMSPEFFRRQVEVCLEERVPLFVAGLGDPSWVVPLAHQVGTKVMGLVGNVRNAERQVKSGVDYIIAQGYEAGGHVGRIANFPLIPLVIDAVAPVPVLAAGAIGDGRTLLAAFALGAVGAWVGTAFLVAEESNIYPEHKDEIIRGELEDFVVTRAYTGKTARDVDNDVIKAWHAAGLDFLPMPLQGILLEDFLYSAKVANRPDLINNPAGQIGAMLKAKRPAREILLGMIREAEEGMERLQSLRR